jgi:methionyl-tRNA synthetase
MEMPLCNLDAAPLWFPLVVLLLLAWTLPWKGVALWRAAGNRHLAWFVCIFIFNTLAILEIIYIFGFSKKKANVGTGT